MDHTSEVISEEDSAVLRVLIAEDNAIMRDGLEALLARRRCCVAGVADASQLLARLAQMAAGDGLPDVVVTDIRMPPTFEDEGLQAALEIRRRYDGLPVLVFSQWVEAAKASSLLTGDARGVGYLLKDRVANGNEFVGALHRLAKGETVLDPEVVSQLARTNASRRGLDRLTNREVEVLDLMAQGRSNGAIAQQLFLSAGAVEKNVASIFAKLDLPVTAADNRRVLAVRHYLGL